MTDAARARRVASAARRREAARLLSLVADMAAYASHQAGNGLAPEAAREAVVEAAAELASAAASLRHLARLWSGRGESVVEVARRLGASERSVHRWLAGDRPGPEGAQVDLAEDGPHAS